MAFLDPARRECLRKMKYGALMGAGLGGTVGLLFGTYEAMRFRGIPISQKMGLVLRNSAGGSVAFGFFLAIGTGIRSCNRERRY